MEDGGQDGDGKEEGDGKGESEAGSWLFLFRPLLHHLNALILRLVVHTLVEGEQVINNLGDEEVGQRGDVEGNWNDGLGGA